MTELHNTELQNNIWSFISGYDQSTSYTYYHTIPNTSLRKEAGNNLLLSFAVVGVSCLAESVTDETDISPDV